MTRLWNSFKTFVKEEDAPTMVEYGLMVALVAIVAMVGATALGTSTNTVFGSIANSL